MLEPKATLSRVTGTGVVVILRRLELGDFLPVIDALLEGGLDCVEVPITYHAGLQALPQLRAQYGDRVCLGAGSVINSDLAVLAAGLQVDFISAPTGDESIVQTCRTRELLSMPGAMTPTEILRAWHVGADLVKVFPARLVGPDYFEAMLHQLPDLALVAAGGVTADNLADFFHAGARAAAVGRGVVSEPDLAARNFAAITQRARRLREIAGEAR